MLRGRYGWLSQRNQFILPSPRPAPPLFGSPLLLPVARGAGLGGREKEGRSKQGGGRRRVHTYAVTYASAHTHTYTLTFV